MDKREQWLTRWGVWAAANWGRSILCGLVLTVLLCVGFIFLKFEMTFYSILPRESSQVRDLQLITEEFPAANAIIAVVEGQTRAQVVQVLDALQTEYGKSAYNELIAGVQSQWEQDFYKQHGLILSPKEELERLIPLYADLSIVPLLTRINNDFEQEYSGNEAKLQQDEELAIAQVEGLDEILKLIVQPELTREEASLTLDKFLFGESYFLNRDGTMGLLFIQPRFTMNDFTVLAPNVLRLEEVAGTVAGRYGAKAGLTGITVVGKDEMVTSEQGLLLSSLLALLLIIGLLIVAFRMFSVPLIAGFPLVVGILWTIGLTGFLIHRLNIMTAMYLIVLLGLGIDYGIHLLSTYIQERDQGQDFSTAIGAAFGKSGPGIVTGALTTAVAFFSLNLAESAVVKELGTVAGLGILCELLAMFLFIPALLGIRQQRVGNKGKQGDLLRRLHVKFSFMSKLGALVKRAPLVILLLMLVLAGLLGINAPGVEVEGNLMNLEAKGLESIRLQDRMVEEFGMAPDSLFITTGDLGELKELAGKLEKLSVIKQVDSLAPYITTTEEWEQREPLIREFAKSLESWQGTGKPVDRELLEAELWRLEDNLLEMADIAFLGGMDKLNLSLNQITGRGPQGSPIGPSLTEQTVAALETALSLDANQALIADVLREKLLAMADTTPVIPGMLPRSLQNSYISRDGKHYLLTLVPTRNPWDEDFRNLYSGQIRSVTDKGTGMLLAADQMTRIARIDGVRAAIAAMIAIFFLLLLDFRNFKLTLLTLLPLLTSFVALFGFMALTGIKFDFINFIAIPLLIGIGVDDVVHINHRYLLEGPGRMDQVISKTGAAVLLTTLTTIIGFASLIPSTMQGMRSTGIVLSVAMAFAFLFSILLHPVLLILLKEKLNLNLSPWQWRKK